MTRLNARSTGSTRRRARGQLLRAGRRRGVRPRRHQPAVRGLAGHGRAAGLPRLRACPATRWSRASSPARRRTCADGGWCAGAGQLGARRAASRGRSGVGWLDRRDRLRRLGGAARGRRPGDVRRAVAPGRGAARRPRTTTQRYDTWLAWFESRASRRSGSAGSTCAASDRRAAPVRLEEWPLRRRAAARARRSADCGARPSSARPTDDELCWRPAGARGPTCARRRSARPGRRTRETIVLRQQRGMRRARQVDTVEAALVGACDGELTVGQILRPGSCWTGRGPASAYLGRARAGREGFLRQRPPDSRLPPIAASRRLRRSRSSRARWHSPRISRVSSTTRSRRRPRTGRSSATGPLLTPAGRACTRPRRRRSDTCSALARRSARSIGRTIWASLHHVASVGARAWPSRTGLG